MVAHSLRGEGFDASEDGTGRGTPLVPVAFNTVATLDARTNAGGFPGSDGAAGGHVVPVAFAIQAGALRTNPNSGPDGIGVQADHAYTLEARAEVQAIAFQSKQSASAKCPSFDEVAPTLDVAKAGGMAAQIGMAVRRLTPRECERLQGFPDDYTAIPWRGKPADQCPDGPRYKALGNSWAVPCVRWIGQRIARELSRGRA